MASAAMAAAAPHITIVTSTRPATFIYARRCRTRLRLRGGRESHAGGGKRSIRGSTIGTNRPSASSAARRWGGGEVPERAATGQAPHGRAQEGRVRWGRVRFVLARGTHGRSGAQPPRGGALRANRDAVGVRVDSGDRIAARRAVPGGENGPGDRPGQRPPRGAPPEPCVGRAQRQVRRERDPGRDPGGGGEPAENRGPSDHQHHHPGSPESVFMRRPRPDGRGALGDQSLQSCRQIGGEVVRPRRIDERDGAPAGVAHGGCEGAADRAEEWEMAGRGCHMAGLRPRPGGSAAGRRAIARCSAPGRGVHRRSFPGARLPLTRRCSPLATAIGPFQGPGGETGRDELVIRRRPAACSWLPVRAARGSPTRSGPHRRRQTSPCAPLARARRGGAHRGREGPRPRRCCPRGRC